MAQRKKIVIKGRKKRDPNKYIRAGYVVKMAFFLLLLICLGLFITNFSTSGDWLKAGQTALRVQGELDTPLFCLSQTDDKLVTFERVPVSLINREGQSKPFDSLFFDARRIGNSDSFSLYVGEMDFHDLEEAYDRYIELVPGDLSSVSESVTTLFRYQLGKIDEKIDTLEAMIIDLDGGDNLRVQEIQMNIETLQLKRNRIKSNYDLYRRLIGDSEPLPYCVDSRLALEEFIPRRYLFEELFGGNFFLTADQLAQTQVVQTTQTTGTNGQIQTVTTVQNAGTVAGTTPSGSSPTYTQYTQQTTTGSGTLPGTTFTQTSGTTGSGSTGTDTTGTTGSGSTGVTTYPTLGGTGTYPSTGGGSYTSPSGTTGSGTSYPGVMTMPGYTGP